MRRFRFNIGSLLVVVLFVAVGFAAVRESNYLWDSSIFSLTLVVLLISILLAVHRTETRREFWFGFALFGSAYLGLSLVPSIESRLITTKGLHYLDSKVAGRPMGLYHVVLHTYSGSGTGNNQVSNVTSTTSGIQALTAEQDRLWRLGVTIPKLLGGWSGTTENFVRIGHSLFALLVGWLGAQLSRRLSRPSRSSEPSTAVSVEGTNS